MKGIFQLILIIVFIAGAIFGVLVFSGTIKFGGDETQASGNIVLWGTVESAVMAGVVENYNNSQDNIRLSYVQKSADNFNESLLEALASGAGPDLFLLPDNLAFHYSNKIFPIPYTSYPLATFRETFVGAGEVFLVSNGILAFPLTVDPLMMYYNRSILDSNAIVYPPKTWDELTAMVPIITKKDTSNKIVKPATVALGYFSNIAHAKDILSAMFMQAGSGIVKETNGSFQSSLTASNPNFNIGSILQFYTNFADPAKEAYSWNRSFSNSVDAFSSEELAFYFGFSSELQDLVNKNPNQNLGAAPIPELTGATTKATSARVTGIAISSASKNLTTAFVAASQIATTDFASKLALGLQIPPARRDLISVKPADALGPIFYDSALYAKSWLDPSPSGTNDIFRLMVDSVLSNNATATEAVTEANAKLGILLLR